MNFRITAFTKIGFLLAGMLSWCVNHSPIWAIFHCLCGWIYVIFWLFKYSCLEFAIKAITFKDYL